MVNTKQKPRNYNGKKFSFVEMVSNTDGKTSGSGTMGVVICAIGGFTFLLGTIVAVFWKVEIEDLLYQSIGLVYAGALLLGYRKSKDGNSRQNDRYDRHDRRDRYDRRDRDDDLPDDNEGADTPPLPDED